MSASGCWCALILLTFTQDSLGSYYEKLLQIEKPKEYLRHQQNHRSSTFVDRKLVDPTEFRAAEIRSALNSSTESHSIAAEGRQPENRHAEIRPIIAQNRAVNLFRPLTEIHSAVALRPDLENRLRTGNRAEEIRSMGGNPALEEIRSMENSRAVAIRPVEIVSTPGRRAVEIASGGKARATTEKRGARIRSTETRSQQGDRRLAEEMSPTEIRPMDIFWTEIEQAETSSIERSQIRHGRSRSHFARQKIEDSSSKDGLKDAVNRIKTNVHEAQENHFRTRQAEKVNDLPKGSVSLKLFPVRNHSWLLERNFSKDNLVNSQSSGRIEDNVPEGLESLVKLYQVRKGSVLEESSASPLTRNLSRLIEQNSKEKSKDNLSSSLETQKNLEHVLKAYHSENHGVLRSSPGSLKGSLKDDPLTKLRKAMSMNKTIMSIGNTIDTGNTTETVGIDPTEDVNESTHDLEEEVLQDVVLDYTSYEEPANASSDRSARRRPQAAQVDIVTRFLRIIENQHTLGENCTAGTDLNLGEGVVDQYAQERFRLEANFAVNRANMLTRLWKYAPEVMLSSEYLLHASVLSMVEFDEDIFAAGNCYDKMQYRDHWLYCPFAHRLPNQDGVLVKDLAVQYKYLSNSSEWFYIARKNAERVITSYEQFSRGFHTYTFNDSGHTERDEDEILTVKYEDGRWSKPYYDCGGGNIWMLTYTVPFFGYVNDTYFFK
ncbi:hypothetical protein X777_16789 [Ooceraea biroi]|uniref:Uncharacterized protein n=1 Tax=Ooceraea biroi TaxID=2015173 RepID=A0A026WWY2_OOCBI|nr:hypothetical protein X777_16789 [Ooceraea biroi]